MLLLSFSCQLVVGRVLGAAWFCRLFFVFLFRFVRFFPFSLFCCVQWGQVVFFTLLSDHFVGSFLKLHLFFYPSKKKEKKKDQ